MERLIDLNEAAKLTGIPAGTLRRYVLDGKLPAVRGSHARVCFTESILENFLANLPKVAVTKRDAR